MLKIPDWWNTLAACVENGAKNKSNEKWTGEEVQASLECICEICKKLKEIYKRHYKTSKELNSWGLMTNPPLHTSSPQYAGISLNFEDPR